ncbi:tetratricopeptide repeat protein [Calothrix sp. NIES-3974]|uniref:tetratricopeptide repeat protein n=1 Tax=Calothrix sp. NIES-3974 TaxID=2005462 RepID=UPI000BBC09DF
MNPESSLVLANRCGVLSKLEKYSQALTSCSFALKGDQRWGKTGEALAWNNQGDVLFNLGRYQESLASFDRALAIVPDNQSIQRNRELVIQQLDLISGNHSQSLE